MRKFGWLLIVLIIMSPLGTLAEGTAWGEWGQEELIEALGFVPDGVSQAGEWWKAAFPDYAVEAFGDSAFASKMGYMVSAAVGSALVYGMMLIAGKWLVKCRSRQIS